MLHRCILLLEDLDAAFTGGITSAADRTANSGSALSISGLLTSLDWPPAEGRCVTVSIRALRFANRPCFFRQACFRHYESR